MSGVNENCFISPRTKAQANKLTASWAPPSRHGWSRGESPSVLIKNFTPDCASPFRPGERREPRVFASPRRPYVWQKRFPRLIQANRSQHSPSRYQTSTERLCGAENCAPARVEIRVKSHCRPRLVWFALAALYPKTRDFSC
jgi:hypothetical protein